MAGSHLYQGVESPGALRAIAVKHNVRNPPGQRRSLQTWVRATAGAKCRGPYTSEARGCLSLRFSPSTVMGVILSTESGHRTSDTLLDGGGHELPAFCYQLGVVLGMYRPFCTVLVVFIISAER
jgi:hypothetical protein